MLQNEGLLNKNANITMVCYFPCIIHSASVPIDVSSSDCIKVGLLGTVMWLQEAIAFTIVDAILFVLREELEMLPSMIVKKKNISFIFI